MRRLNTVLSVARHPRGAASQSSPVLDASSVDVPPDPKPVVPCVLPPKSVEPPPKGLVFVVG